MSQVTGKLLIFQKILTHNGHRFLTPKQSNCHALTTSGLTATLRGSVVPTQPKIKRIFCDRKTLSFVISTRFLRFSHPTKQYQHPPTQTQNPRVLLVLFKWAFYRKCRNCSFLRVTLIVLMPLKQILIFDEYLYTFASASPSIFSVIKAYNTISIFRFIQLLAVTTLRR